MKIVNIHEAKTQLSKYLQDVAEGKEIVIGKYGQPVARLVPYMAREPKYRLGLLKGTLAVPVGFDEPDERVAALFESQN